MTAFVVLFAIVLGLGAFAWFLFMGAQPITPPVSRELPSVQEYAEAKLGRRYR